MVRMGSAVQIRFRAPFGPVVQLVECRSPKPKVPGSSPGGPAIMAYQDLIILCFYLISAQEKSCSFELVTAECFNRFPNKFSFKNYPQWPDARRLDRALRGLREEGKITGDPKKGFKLTKDGLKRAQEISKYFRQEKLF